MALRSNPASGAPAQVEGKQGTMGTNAVLRQRRTAAQVHALAQVEQEIRANDSKGRCRYLREYAEAFGSYDRVLSGQELQSTLLQSD
ncbi:MAG: hypothetical protein AB7O65_13365, partial [Candidatus Korobacteraceae bacterium]